MHEDANQTQQLSLIKDMEKLKGEYEKTNAIVKKIKELGEEYVKLNNLIKDENNGIDVTYNKIISRQKDVELIKENADTRLTEIEDNLKKIKNNINEFQNAYNEFSELKGRIAGKSNEIEVIREAVDGLKKDVERIKTEAQSTLDSITNLLTDVQEKIQSMQEAYEEFLKIQSKIEDEENGFNAVFEKIQLVLKKSGPILNEIQSFKDESSDLLKTIITNKDETDKLKTKILDNLEFTLIKKNEIENATGLIIDTSFAETFERRKREIENGLNGWFSWKKIFFVSVVLLAIVVILPYTPLMKIDSDNTFDYFIKRFFITSPMLFLIAFSSIQYSRERDLAEKYAFKASSSAAIRSHIDYLKGIYGIKNDRFEAFAINTFSTIYKEPYGDDDIKEKLKVIERTVNDLSSRDSKKRFVSIKNLLESTKELRTFIPDDTAYKNSIELISKVISKN